MHMHSHIRLYTHLHMHTYTNTREHAQTCFLVVFSLSAATFRQGLLFSLPLWTRVHSPSENPLKESFLSLPLRTLVHSSSENSVKEAFLSLPRTVWRNPSSASLWELVHFPSEIPSRVLFVCISLDLSSTLHNAYTHKHECMDTYTYISRCTGTFVCIHANNTCTHVRNDQGRVWAKSFPR